MMQLELSVIESQLRLRDQAGAALGAAF